MSRRRKHQVWKQCKSVKQFIKKINKDLKEDCYAGRFEVKKLDTVFSTRSNWINGRPKNININEWAKTQWTSSLHLIKIIDNEIPDRNVEMWFEYSDTSKLSYPIANGEFLSEQWLKNVHYITNDGSSSIYEVLNNFIVESDFWNKWNEFDYAKTHWYSGDQLKKMVALFGEKWKSAEALNTVKPDRFLKSNSII